MTEGYLVDELHDTGRLGAPVGRARGAVVGPAAARSPGARRLVPVISYVAKGARVASEGWGVRFPDAASAAGRS